GQTLYAVGSLTEGGVLHAEGADAKGIYTAMNYSPDINNAANRTFAWEYAQAYNAAPSFHSMAAFDAANVIDKAAAIAGSDLTPQSINEAIGRVGQIDSPRGLWEFTSNRTPQQRWYLRQVRLNGSVLGNVLISELAVL